MSESCWVLPLIRQKPGYWPIHACISIAGRRFRCRANVQACVPLADVLKCMKNAYDDDEDGVSAYLRVQHARENTSETLRRLHGGDLIYGDVDLELALGAISRTIQPGDTFLDAGSGFGRIVLAVACKYPGAKSVGVEIVQALHDEAVEMKNIVKEMWEAGGRVMGDCELVCGDFREVCELKGMQADVVFAFCTTWRGAVDGFVEGMFPVVERLHSGARVILVDGKLPCEIGEMKLVEEWMTEEKNAATGSSTVRMYKVHRKRTILPRSN